MSAEIDRALNEKLKWIYEHYGTDMAAFFRDVNEAKAAAVRGGDAPCDRKTLKDSVKSRVSSEAPGQQSEPGASTHPGGFRWVVTEQAIPFHYYVAPSGQVCAKVWFGDPVSGAAGLWFAQGCVDVDMSHGRGERLNCYVTREAACAAVELRYGMGDGRVVEIPRGQR